MINVCPCNTYVALPPLGPLLTSSFHHVPNALSSHWLSAFHDQHIAYDNFINKTVIDITALVHFGYLTLAQDGGGPKNLLLDM